MNVEEVECQLRQKQQKLWNVVPSEFSELCSNPIRKIVDNIKKPSNTDKELIPLSLGDPTVFGNLNCPNVMVEAIVRNVRSFKYNGYAHSAGLECARQAIAQKYSTSKSPLTIQDVVIASGCSGALEIAFTGLLNKGDNILLPHPAFSLYQVICDTYQIESKYYRLLPDKNWEIDLEHMESLIDSNTKAILINNPSNPCGSVFTRDHLLRILALAETHRIPIISDEIYADMVFHGNAFYPIASLTTSVPVVAVGGLAKQYLIPGWRVGWITIHDCNGILEQLRNAYFKLSQLIIGANTLVQSIIPDLLTPVAGSAEEESLIKFKEEYLNVLSENAAFTVDRLGKISSLSVIVPQGAMYVMVRIEIDQLNGIKDDCEFAQKLLDEESVFVLPGQCFGLENYFRVVFSAPKEKLELAYGRIAVFCKRYSKNL